MKKEKLLSKIFRTVGLWRVPILNLPEKSTKLITGNNSEISVKKS